MRTLSVLALVLAALLAAPSRAAAVPVVFVHGIDGGPEDWRPVVPDLARGRPVELAAYPADTDLYATGSMSPQTLFVIGYYREKTGSPRFYTDRRPVMASIGGAPVARTDASAARYQISYAAQLDRMVENICRATGSPRVDMVCFSMGGLVGRSYVRFLSLKAPGGQSRVRRLLTICSPNHGINTIEATGAAIWHEVIGRHEAAQGEIAEMDYECPYWGGHSFVDLLESGWDAFCQQAGVDYAAGFAHGHSIESWAAIRAVATALAQVPGPFQTQLLPYPAPGFNLQREIAEATGDGDSVVRVTSSYRDPATFPHVRFNSRFSGTHADADDERCGCGSTWNEQLCRAFLLDGVTAGGFAVSGASVKAIDAGGQATWLEVQATVTGGTPLSAEVVVTPHRNAFLNFFLAPFGVDEKCYGMILYPGAQARFVDPVGSSGDCDVVVRYYGLDAEVDMPAARVNLKRGSRPLASTPAATIGNAQGGALPVSAPPGAEVSIGLDAGAGATYGAFGPAAPFALAGLAPGEYEVVARARGAGGASSVVVEGARPAAVHISVAPGGAVSVTR